MKNTTVRRRIVVEEFVTTGWKVPIRHNAERDPERLPLPSELLEALRRTLENKCPLRNAGEGAAR